MKDHSKRFRALRDAVKVAAPFRLAIEAGAFAAFREGFYRDLKAGEPD